MAPCKVMIGLLQLTLTMNAGLVSRSRIDLFSKSGRLKDTVCPETTTMTGKSSGASSRSDGAGSSAGERSVRQAEYAVHREAVTDRLDAIEAGAAEYGGAARKIEDSTAENGGRLEKIEGMLGHLQNVLDDILANQDADEPNSDEGQHNGAASARGSMSDKLWLKERITAWKNSNLRAVWILCGEKPKGCELSWVQLQGVFKNTALWHLLR